MAESIAIVGAGVAGLSAAFELRREGFDVEVFEESDRPGGVIETTSTTTDGYKLEWAANGFIPSSDGAMELVRALNIPTVEARPEARNRWVFFDGALHPVPASPRDLLSSSLLPWRAKLNLVAEPFRSPVLDREESVDEFARRRLGAHVARSVVAPFVTGIFAGDSQRLSLKAAFPKLYELERKGGLLRGGVATLVEKLAAGQRSDRRIVAPRDGMASLTDGLAHSLGDSLRLQTKICRIRCAATEPVVCWDGGEKKFSAVVLALPAEAAALLCDTELSTTARDFADIEHAPVAVVQLGFARRDIAHDLDGFGFLVAKEESPRLLGAVFESVVWPGRAPPGQVLIRCILGGTRDPSILALDDRAIYKQCVSDLNRVLGHVGDPLMTRVRRHRPGIAQYTFGHLQRVSRLLDETRAARIVLTGSPYFGVSINQCIASRKRVVQAVRALFAVLLIVCGCGGGGAAQRSSEPDGAQARVPSERVQGNSLSEPQTTELSVVPQWLWPPAPLRASTRRNACGEPAGGALSVHVMGGVHNAVVVLRGLAYSSKKTPRLIVGPCETSSRVVVAQLGSEIELVSMGTDPMDVFLSHKQWQRKVSFRVTGQRFSMPLRETGVIEVAVADDPAVVSTIFVSEFAAKVTDERGEAHFSEVPLGTREIAVWHSPITRDHEISIVHKADVQRAPRHEVSVPVAASAGLLKRRSD